MSSLVKSKMKKLRHKQFNNFLKNIIRSWKTKQLASVLVGPLTMLVENSGKHRVGKRETQ